MAELGHFSAEMRPLAWFNAEAVPEGWLDYALPFTHELMSVGAAIAPPTGGRIWKLAGRGGGMAGPPIGLAG